MEKFLKVLKKCPLFYGIGESDLLRMLGCFGAKVEFFDKKYTVMAEGSTAKYIGIVLSGAAQIVQVDYYGNRSIFANIEEGNTFAEAFACAGTENIPIAVIADEPSEIMLVDCSHILHTCSNNCGFHNQLIYNLMRSLAEKNIAFHKKIEVTSKRTTRDKLMTYLMHQSKRVGKSEFEIPFDRQELADYLEVERSGLSAEISKLTREGILESNKNRFILK